MEVAEAHALPSDVLVQFLRRSIRARLLARAGRFGHAERLAREAISIASLTDALRDRATAHAALAEVLVLQGDARGAEQEERVAMELLRRKGVEGAPVGTPSA